MLLVVDELIFVNLNYILLLLLVFPTAIKPPVRPKLRPFRIYLCRLMLRFLCWVLDVEFRKTVDC